MTARRKYGGRAQHMTISAGCAVTDPRCGMFTKTVVSALKRAFGQTSTLRPFLAVGKFREKQTKPTRKSQMAPCGLGNHQNSKTKIQVERNNLTSWLSACWTLEEDPCGNRGKLSTWIFNVWDIVSEQNCCDTNSERRAQQGLPPYLG